MDIFAEVTDRIIEQLNQGIIPWQKPWIARGAAISHVTGKPYSILNQLMLRKPGEYLTYNQCKAEGGCVRKGEKAQMVVFWKFIDREDADTHETVKVPLLRYYSVFHVSQCEGIKEKHLSPLPGTAESDDAADAIITDYISREGVTLQEVEGNSAFYQPFTDSVTVPTKAQFTETAEFYSTVFHELTHSTGHEKRLNRLDKVACFGSDDYSKEELVAEIGAAALVNHVGLETAKSFRNSAAYLQNWLTVLKSDKRFIVSAAGKAEKAVNLILGAA